MRWGTLALTLSLTLALGACTPDGGGAGPDGASPPAPSAAAAPAAPGRDIPVTEIVRTEDEKDLRLIGALRAVIPALMHGYGSPGFNIALARRGDVVWEAGFGHADLAARTPMTPETVFQSGSMGKLYTGMAILKLVEDGVLELDGPINDYLPFEVRNPLGGRDITVRDLLTHRPGLMQDAALSLFERPRSLREEIEAEYGRAMVPMMGGDSMPRWHAEAGEAFMYSNLGMGTLGLIVEENNPEGLSYSEFVERHFMEPLGMRYSQYPPVQDREHIRPDIWERRSTGYMPMGSVWIPTPAVYFGEFPAGGFVATPGDFVRFFLAFLNGGEYGGARVLAPETVELALTPQSESMGGLQMGLAWMLDKVGEPAFNIQHGGAHMYGWQNWGIAWPNFDTAVVYATNNWAVPEIAPDVTMLRSVIENWLLLDAAVPEVAEPFRGRLGEDRLVRSRRALHRRLQLRHRHSDARVRRADSRRGGCRPAQPGPGRRPGQLGPRGVRPGRARPARPWHGHGGGLDVPGRPCDRLEGGFPTGLSRDRRQSGPEHVLRRAADPAERRGAERVSRSEVVVPAGILAVCAGTGTIRDMAYTIDTAAAVERLEAAGVDTAAARAIVETVAVADDSLATKADLAALKADLTVRIIAAQVATATLLFAALRFL